MSLYIRPPHTNLHTHTHKNTQRSFMHDLVPTTSCFNQSRPELMRHKKKKRGPVKIFSMSEASHKRGLEAYYS